MLNYYLTQIKSMIYVAPVILLAITMHELAHGYVSYRLGDDTPKRDGRLSLNPFRHLDPMGTLCLLFFHMGWAKPVRINTACYRNRKRGIILVSLAGPCMNFILAFLSVLLYGILLKFGSATSNAVYVVAMLAYYSAVVNIGLGVFNLVPIPPLDGSNVLSELWSGVERFYYRIRPYRSFLLILLLVSGILSRPLSYVDNAMLSGMWKVVETILGLGTPSGAGGNYI